MSSAGTGDANAALAAAPTTPLRATYNPISAVPEHLLIEAKRKKGESGSASGNEQPKKKPNVAEAGSSDAPDGAAADDGAPKRDRTAASLIAAADEIWNRHIRGTDAGGFDWRGLSFITTVSALGLDVAAMRNLMPARESSALRYMPISVATAQRLNDIHAEMVTNKILRALPKVAVREPGDKPSASAAVAGEGVLRIRHGKSTGGRIEPVLDASQPEYAFLPQTKDGITFLRLIIRALETALPPDVLQAWRQWDERQGLLGVHKEVLEKNRERRQLRERMAAAEEALEAMRAELAESDAWFVERRDVLAEDFPNLDLVRGRLAHLYALVQMRAQSQPPMSGSPVAVAYVTFNRLVRDELIYDPDEAEASGVRAASAAAAALEVKDGPVWEELRADIQRLHEMMASKIADRADAEAADEARQMGDMMRGPAVYAATLRVELARPWSEATIRRAINAYIERQMRAVRNKTLEMLGGMVSDEAVVFGARRASLRAAIDECMQVHGDIRPDRDAEDPRMVTMFGLLLRIAAQFQEENLELVSMGADAEALCAAAFADGVRFDMPMLPAGLYAMTDTTAPLLSHLTYATIESSLTVATGPVFSNERLEMVNRRINAGVIQAVASAHFAARLLFDAREPGAVGPATAPVMRSAIHNRIIKLVNAVFADLDANWRENMSDELALIGDVVDSTDEMKQIVRILRTQLDYPLRQYAVLTLAIHLFYATRDAARDEAAIRLVAGSGAAVGEMEAAMQQQLRYRARLGDLRDLRDLPWFTAAHENRSAAATLARALGVIPEPM